MGKFVVSEMNGRLQFCLQEDNGTPLAASVVYKSMVGCCKGINSVMKNAPRAHVEDRTAEQFEKQVNPKFIIYQNEDGKYQFSLCARNGETISISVEYSTYQDCLYAIQTMRINAADADPEFI